MQLQSDLLTLAWVDGLDWAAMFVAPQRARGSSPWRSSNKVARKKQGITASSP